MNVHISDEDVFYALATILSILAVIIISIVVQIFYLLTAASVLKAVRPQFREAQPGQVWLNFIPAFNFIWPFIINQQIVASVEADFAARGIRETGKADKTIAALYPALRFGIFIPVAGRFFILLYLVAFIVWWVKLFRYKKLLRTGLYTQRNDEETLDN